jgi:translation initiation factor 2 beta subunit (eIF-2beta)/eIF-5
MKKLSETYKELGIDFTFPITIQDANGKLTYYENRRGWQRLKRDANGNPTYYENSNDYWEKWERDEKGNVTYYEDSKGDRKGTPRSTTNQ